jgi:NAD(P)-dependent dehydrogenase (short-subunit alcohol dehydrogenase family)
VTTGVRPGWTVELIPDQRGRVAVVTGANSGLGLETTRELARKGAHVVMAVRSRDKGDAARRSVEASLPDAQLEIRQCDLSSLESVRMCADGIAADHGRVDVLVNNAGVMGIPEQTTRDGFEMQLGVNHLGHFVLTRRLLPALVAAGAGRVVSVTSFARLTGRPVRVDNPHLRGNYRPWRAYGQSKLANLQFALELARRLEAAGSSVQSLAAHPGFSHTDLQARSVRETSGGLSQRFWYVMVGAIGSSPAQGALPLLRAATDPHARGGELYGPLWGSSGPPVRRSLLSRSRVERPARQLWELSERETGEPFDVAAIVAGHR